MNVNKERFRTIWRAWLGETGLSELTISKDLGIIQQSLNRSAKNGNMQFMDFLTILEHYGYEIRIEKRHS